MGYLIVVALSYLIGTSSMTLYLSKLRNINMRAGGSGNLGASNTTALFGWSAGILVALHDIGKSALVVCLARLLFPEAENIGLVAGVASVLGHIFPFYLKFRGGKGFASFWGMTLALNWKLALILALVSILITLITDYIVLATTTTVITVPVYFGIATHSLLPPLILLLATAVILWKHRDNYRRILKGEEMGLRKASRGEYRIK